MSSNLQINLRALAWQAFVGVFGIILCYCIVGEAKAGGLNEHPLPQSAIELSSHMADGVTALKTADEALARITSPLSKPPSLTNTSIATPQSENSSAEWSTSRTLTALFGWLGLLILMMYLFLRASEQDL